MNPETKLSKNLRYREAVRSYTALTNGIENSPSKQQLINMFILANNCFQPIRDYFDTAIYVSSFFRNEELNTLVGGSVVSDHLRGAAIDLDADVFGEITNSDIFYYVLAKIPFKLLIWEFGDDNNPDWVHISYQQGYNHMRRVLKAEYINGEKIYKNFN